MKRAYLLFALAGTFFSGCDVERPRLGQMREIGIFGPHRVSRIVPASDCACSERMLQIFWGRNAGESFSTTLPFSMFRFNIDDALPAPTVQFIFDEKWLNSEQIVYGEAEKTNLNWWMNEENIKNKNFRAAVLRLPRADFLQLVCPQR